MQIPLLARFRRHSMLLLLWIVASYAYSIDMDQSCVTYGIDGLIQRAYDEAIDVAQNALELHQSPDLHVRRLFASLIGDTPSRVQDAGFSFMSVAAYAKDQPDFSIYCNDNFITPLNNEVYFNSITQSVLGVTSPFAPCDGGKSAAYVLGAQLVICPALFKRSAAAAVPTTLRPLMSVDVTGYSLDHMVYTLTGTLLHELFHTLLQIPHIIDQSVETLPGMGPAGAYGFINCWYLAYHDMQNTPPTTLALENADTLASLALGLWFKDYDFSTGVARRVQAQAKRRTRRIQREERYGIAAS
ncbi:MAG: hypothetical protein M1817_000316 [Caeruleum heppii]|nr:MAG: hypothetical protein M1817_000316 [Caeruleum heppii]